MIEIRVNGRALVLAQDTEVSLDLLNPGMLLELEDSWTLPFEVPVRGNEIALGHAAALALGDRVVTHENAELYVDGIRLHVGVLDVMGSSADVVRCSFRVDGFIHLVKDKKLRELVKSEPIIVTDIFAHAKSMNDLHWPASSHCFPSYFNPEIYGSANPNWYPSAPTWEATKSYAVNDLVTFAMGTPLTHPWRFQCIGATSAGESPLTTPAKWRKTAFGIVNAYDHTSAEYFKNDGVAEYHTLVPWFYLKYIVQEALKAVDYAPAGTWWTDTQYDKRAVINHQTLDTDARRYYFLASQTGPASDSYGDGAYDGYSSVHQLECDDDSTLPNEDVDNVWNPTTFRWTCPEAGQYRFRFKIPANFYDNDTAIAFGLVKVGPPNTVRAGGIYMPSHPPSSPFSPFGWNGLVNRQVTMSSADVGAEFFPAAWYHTGAGVLHYMLFDTWIQGWKNEGSTYPDSEMVIDPREHMPDVTLDDLLLDLRLTYDLHITIDHATKVVNLNYASDQLRAAPANWHDRSRGEPEMDHGRRMNGLAFSWDIDVPDVPDLKSLIYHGTYDAITDIDEPPGPGMWAIVLSSRMILISTVSNEGFVWVIKGHYLEKVLLGEENAGETVTPKMGPMLTVLVSILDEQFVIPWISEEGNSRYYPSARKEASLRCVDFQGKEGNANHAPVPHATSWGRAMADGSPYVDAVPMNWPDKRSSYDQHWKQHAAILIAGDPVQMDLELDHRAIMNQEHHRRVVINSQEYLVERLPTTYTKGRLLSEGAELLRINPAPA